MKRIILAAIMMVASIAIGGEAADINTGQMTQVKHDGVATSYTDPLPAMVYGDADGVAHPIEAQYTAGAGWGLTVRNNDNPAAFGVGNYVSPDGTTWVKQAGDVDGRTLVTDNSNKNPLATTTHLFYETTGAATNLKITPTMPAGTQVWVSKIAVHNLSATEGEVSFCFSSDGTTEFYGGWLGARPSGFGDDVYCYGTNAGIWVSAPGACKIIIHYKTGSVGP